MKRQPLSHVRVWAILVLLAALTLRGPSVTPAQARMHETAIPTSGSGAGLLFVENAGQFAKGALFQMRGPDLTLWLAQDALWLTVVEPPSAGARFGGAAGANIKLSFPGANPHARLEPFNRLETHVSFFVGSDPAGWRPDVPVWGGVRYANLYPGIDLELNGERGRLAARFAPQRMGADLRAVRLRVEGAQGVRLEAGELRLSTAAGDVTWPLPAAPDGGSIARPTVVPDGDRAFEVIPPFAPAAGVQPGAAGQVRSPSDNPADLLYGTFLGGAGDDQAYDIAVDTSGAAYVTGETTSPDFPTTPGAFDSLIGGGDTFVAKLSPNGSALAYATFLGGSSSEGRSSLAVDGSGAAYVLGGTVSIDFPTTPGAFDTSYNGDVDAYLVKLNASGSALHYGTFLGGAAADQATAVTVGGGGAAYATGQTSSSEFPTTPGAFDTIPSGDIDAFVVKLSTDGSALDYATFLGGSAVDTGWDIALNGSGAAYVTGNTTSADFPTTPGAFETSYSVDDGFVVKLNPDGSALDYGTYLGGSGDESGQGIAVNGSGAAFVTGNTTSPDFPTTPGAFDTTYNSGTHPRDAYLVKLSASGSVLEYGTFLGGSADESGYGIAVNGSGAAYVTGWTMSSDLPTTPLAFDRSYNGGPQQGDAFIARLSADGAVLEYGTFLGGSAVDWGRRIAVDETGVAYIAGVTDSADFATTQGAFDTTYNGGGGDAFVAKLATTAGVTYTISGRVTDAGDQGIPGVAISAGPAGSAVTDAGGYYSIGYVVTGTYTLAPAPICYSFDPVTRTVAVPPDATAQDFSGAPVTCFRLYLPLATRKY